MYGNEMNHKVTQWVGEVINKHGTSIGITSSKIFLKTIANKAIFLKN